MLGKLRKQQQCQQHIETETVVFAYSEGKTFVIQE
jgi:hypothetical protein